MSFGGIAREGFITGSIGAAIVAGWFLIVDAVVGRPFFTPAMLGRAFFWGVSDPTAVEISLPAVAGYSMVHVLAFVLIGIVAAVLACQVERAPATLFIVVVFFAVFEFGFYVIVALVAQPILGAMAWWAVAIGNAFAALGMGYFLWHAHPRLRQALSQHPLGAVAD
jgi:hypothetical protein